jgi:hypothetical protein
MKLTINLRSVDGLIINKQLIYILILSVLSSLLIFSLTSTLVMKVFFSLASFAITFLLLLILFDFKTFSVGRPQNLPNLLVSTYRKIPFSVLLHLLALFASAIVVAIPSVNILIDPKLVWASFASLSLLSVLKVVSGYFLISIFPGMIIVFYLFKKYDLGIFEKTCLVLAISYCYSVTIGLILVNIGVFSSFSFIISLWAPAVIYAIHALRQKKIEVGKPQAKQIDFKLDSLMMLTICLVFVVSSYLLVLFVGPFTGLMSGDVKSYMNVANEIASFGPFSRTLTNIWSSFFMWLAGYLTGLPLLYAYVGLQFYQLVFPLSFYFLLRTLFPKRQHISSVGTLFLILINGVTSLYTLFTAVNSPNIFNTYMNGNVYSVLINIFHKTGSPGIASPMLGTVSFDVPLVFLALAFAYKYLTANTDAFHNILLAAIFTGAAFFTHNINLMPIVFGAAIVFSLLQEVSWKRLGTLIFSIIATILLLDPISGFLLGGTLTSWLSLPISQTSPYLKVVVILMGLLAACLFLMGLRHQIHGLFRKVFTRLSNSFSRYKNCNTSGKVKLVLWSIGISIFILSLYMYFSNLTNIDYIGIWSNPSYTFPWYFIVFRNYGPVFPLAIGALLIAGAKTIRKPLLFVLGCLLTMVIFMLASIMIPSVLLPSIIYVRMAGFVLIPLSIVAALNFESSFGGKIERYKKRIRIAIKYLVPLLLTLVISISFLSQVYSRETFFVPDHQAISQETADAIGWLENNVPKGTYILPLSQTGYTLINNFALNLRALPIFWQYSPTWLSYSWLRAILLGSESSETVLCALSNLGASYIFVTSSDISQLKQDSNDGVLFSLLSSFPIAYENKDITIYAVPEYPLYEDSNYVLVIPTLDEFNGYVSNNTVAAFNLLILGGVKFSIQNDADLSELKSGYVYIFPSNHIMSSDLKNFTNNGATVISLDSQFYSLDELNRSTTLNLIEHSKETIVPANTSSIKFADGATYNLENITVNSSFQAKVNQQSLAYCSLSDGTKIPYLLFEPHASGALFYMDASLVQDISNVTTYQELIQRTFATMKPLLPTQNVPSEQLILPYSDDLFKYALPNILELRFLEGVHNVLLCYNTSQIQGKIKLAADNILLSNEEFPVEKIVIQSPSGDFTIQNSTLANLTISGSSIISSDMSRVDIENAPSGPYSILTINDSESELSYSNAKIDFEAHLNGEKQHFHLSNSSVTITFKVAVKILVKQPTITIDGTINSSLQGVVLHKDLFFYVPQEYSDTTIKGNFSLVILYSSGFLYSNIANITEVQVASAN